MQQGRTLDFGAGIWGNVFTAETYLCMREKGPILEGVPRRNPGEGRTGELAGAFPPSHSDALILPGVCVLGVRGSASKAAAGDRQGWWIIGVQIWPLFTCSVPR